MALDDGLYVGPSAVAQFNSVNNAAPNAAPVDAQTSENIRSFGDPPAVIPPASNEGPISEEKKEQDKQDQDTAYIFLLLMLQAQKTALESIKSADLSDEEKKKEENALRNEYAKTIRNVYGLKDEDQAKELANEFLKIDQKVDAEQEAAYWFNKWSQKGLEDEKEKRKKALLGQEPWATAIKQAEISKQVTITTEIDQSGKPYQAVRYSSAPPKGLNDARNSADKGPLIRYAEEMARQYGLDPEMFVRQLWQESGFRRDAKGPPTRYGVAMGIGQFIPDTWKQFGEGDPYNPENNIRAAAKYMRHLTDKYCNGDQVLALAAYNGGPGAIKGHKNVESWIAYQQEQIRLKGAGGFSDYRNQTLNYVLKITGGGPAGGQAVPNYSVSQNPANTPTASAFTAAVRNTTQQQPQAAPQPPSTGVPGLFNSLSTKGVVATAGEYYNSAKSTFSNFGNWLSS